MMNWNPKLLQLYPKLQKFTNFKKYHERFHDQMSAEDRFKKLGGKLPAKKKNRDED